MRKVSDLKYERSWLEIDLGAISSNIRSVRRRIDDDSVKVMAVIKADAYGHGAVAVAKELEALVDFFGVAEIDEAEELRAAGIRIPILILGYTSPSDYGRLLAQDVRPTIYRLEDAKKLSEMVYASAMNSTGKTSESAPAGAEKGAKRHAGGERAKIHLALDTGMTRIGFLPGPESMEAVCEIAAMEGIEIEGLFTHFSCADMSDKTYTAGQMAAYDAFAAELKERGVDIPLCHIENSAGIMEFDHHRLSMVRSGIVTYGLYPSDEVNTAALELAPAMTWKSRVVAVKTVGAGLGVSYGATYTTKGGERIATISTGYGDGYPRSLSGKGYVLIHGRRAPILGRVCMDQFMVDVSGVPDVQVEDIVTLLGTDGAETITAETLGDLSGRFNYELVCDINKRVPRYYAR